MIVIRNIYGIFEDKLIRKNNLRLLHTYINGNTTVRLYSDGTKIRYSNDDEFAPQYPESIDLKITNFCDMNCLMCHESSNDSGVHGNLNEPFLNTLMPGTELAIGGGNPLSHPDLIPFLERLKIKSIVANITVHQYHLLKDKNKVEYLIDNQLIFGLGVSITKLDDPLLEFLKKYPNTVVHLIIGYHSLAFIKSLRNKNIKILLLGYKTLGRGRDYYSESINVKILEIENSILNIITWFPIISFDNLSLNQLRLKEKVSKKLWERRYQGDDGSFTMFVDLVERNYSISSIAENRYLISNDIQIMFKKLKKGGN